MLTSIAAKATAGAIIVLAIIAWKAVTAKK
jgi:hypothetical protein